VAQQGGYPGADRLTENRSFDGWSISAGRASMVSRSPRCCSATIRRCGGAPPGLSAPMYALRCRSVPFSPGSAKARSPIKYLKYLIILVGAPGFEPGTPSPPDWCANRAALRSAAIPTNVYADESGRARPASCDGGRVDLGLRLAWLGDRAEFLLVACFLHAQIRSRRLEAAEWVAGIACTFAERPSSPRSPTAGA
jgi:hypothetical protein